MSRTTFYVQVALSFLYPLQILAYGSNNRGASSQLERKRKPAKIYEKNSFSFIFQKYILKLMNYLDLFWK